MRNLHISKPVLLSLGFLLTCFILTTTVNAQVTCNLNPAFQYTLVPNSHVNFKGTSSDSSVSSKFTTETYNVPSGSKTPMGIITGDFNGDGKLDLVCTDSASNDIAVFLGMGDGSFAPSAGYNSGGSGPVNLVSADFNGDGKMDVAVVNSASDYVTIFSGNGDGTFTKKESDNVGTNPYMVATTDFNGDKIPDLAVTNSGSNSVSILLGNGDGTFTAATPLSTGTGTTPKGITTADFNGDGKADLAVANYAKGTVSIFLGNGAGGFSASSGSPFAAADFGVVTGDFNGDGKPDLATVPYKLQVGTVLLNTNDGTGNFTNPNGINALQPAGITGGLLATGDINGDGITDLLVPDYTLQFISLCFGNGDGTFQQPVLLNSQYISHAVVTGDFNGDGKTDVACTNSSANNINVFLNPNGPTTTSWHWDFGDGDTSNLQNPSHTYATDTVFNVCLTATNSFGCTKSTCQQVSLMDTTLQISPANSIICGGGTKTLNLSGATGNNYQWEISPDEVNWTYINGATNSTYTTSSANGFTNEFYRLLQFTGTGYVVSNAANVAISVPVIVISVTNITNNGVTLNWGPQGTGNYSISYSGTTTGTLTSETPPKTLIGLFGGGTYNITVTQAGVTGGCTASGSIVVNLNGDSCRLASYFGYSVDTAMHVSFHDLSTDSSVNSTITSRHWNFGDGDSSAAQNPIHIYSTGTNYNVCLTVTNSLGCTNQYCMPISLLKCRGGYVTAVRDTICTGATGSLSLITNNNSIQWQSSTDDINFTNINGATSTAYKTVPLPQTTWYRAKVDSSTCSAFSDTLKLYVPAPLRAFFTSTQTGADQLTFNSDSSAGAIYSYSWDFGDGQSSNEKNPIHQFSKDTTYHICLTLYDATSCSYVYCVDTKTTSQTPQGGQASPAYSIICSGGTKTLVVAGASGGSYQWQISPDNSNWSNISGATDTIYTTASANGSINEFYRLMTQYGASTTAEVDVSKPVITVTASNITNQSVTLNWLPAGSGNYTINFAGSSSSLITSVTPPETITGLVSNGTYNITVTQTGVTGGCSASGTKEVNLISDSCRLMSYFGYSVDTLEHVSFHDLSTDSTTNTSGITSWLWNFGDGDTATIQNPTHIYATGTNYNVCLTVNNSLGCTQTFCRQILTTSPVGCRLVSNFSFTANNSGMATFQDLSTDSAKNGVIASWNWDFGDGSGNFSDQNPTHQFVTGLHNVCLTVTDLLGCTNQFCKQVEIDSSSINCRLTAQFSFNVNDTSGIASFTDLSTDSTSGAGITTWHWDFGNGNTSNRQNYSLYYFGDSTFNVCLTVTNSFGCTQTICKQVVVNLISCKLIANYNYTTDTTGLVSFHDLSIDSSTNDVTGWNWNFGDPGSSTDYSYQQNATHIFTTSGTYNVCLTAINIQGCENSICKQVTVNTTVSSLCMSAYLQDTTAGSQPNQQTEFYLIKAFNTSGGDSLAVVDTFIYRGQDPNYCFNAIPNGTYYAKAALTPASPQYASYFPTYFNAVLKWDDATPLNLNGTEYLAITLLKGSNPGGPGFIGGYVTQGANRIEQGASTNSFGDPIPGKLVLLMTASGDPVAHTATDAQGHYQFTNLAYGMYDLSLDELNRPCPLLPVMIDDSSGYLEDANFQYNTKSITGGIALIATTVNKYPFTVKLLGSPVTDELTLYLQNMSSDALITVTDLLGRKSLESNATQQASVVKLNVQNLASGIYLVTVNSGSDVKTIKFVKD